jgi:flagellar L-ring protein precursor FlgH
MNLAHLCLAAVAARRLLWLAPLNLMLVVLAAQPAAAQSSSLFGGPSQRPPLTMAVSSWTYVPAPPQKEIQINDLITVVVQQTSLVVSEGKVNRLTQSNIDARLRDWVELDGFGIGAAAMEGGDPRARASLDSLLRTNMNLETKDRMAFTITARVVDIRPNGNLVLEAHSRYQSNNEIWEQALTGVVRREDISPANTVMSEKIYELSVHKREAGHVRDAYRRGWFLQWLDRHRPF